MSELETETIEAANVDHSGNTRDERGRWRKGHCPNPKGRPRKKRASNYDPSDFRHFTNTQIELVVNGEVQQMGRKEALFHKMFESAMKGRVSMQRHLMQRIESNEAELSELRQQYHAFVYERILDNPHFEGLDVSLSNQERYYLITMAATLNHYHPGQFDEFLPKPLPVEEP